MAGRGCWCRNYGCSSTVLGGRGRSHDLVMPVSLDVFS